MNNRKRYHEYVVAESVSRATRKKFNWTALLLWLLSLVISLVPVYIPLIQHLIKTNGVITGDFWFACFKEYDILWTVATVLLFSCVNQVTIERKNEKSRNLVKNMSILGVVLFVVVAATWIAFKYWLEDYQAWPVTFGLVLVIASMVIATPLQIDFIKNED